MPSSIMNNLVVLSKNNIQISPRKITVYEKTYWNKKLIQPKYVESFCYYMLWLVFANAIDYK